MEIFLVQVESCLVGARLFVIFQDSNAPLLRLVCQKNGQEEEEAAKIMLGNVSIEDLLNRWCVGHLLQVKWCQRWESAWQVWTLASGSG